MFRFKVFIYFLFVLVSSNYIINCCCTSTNEQKRRSFLPLAEYFDQIKKKSDVTQKSNWEQGNQHYSNKVTQPKNNKFSSMILCSNGLCGQNTPSKQGIRSAISPENSLMMTNKQIRRETSGVNSCNQHDWLVYLQNEAACGMNIEIRCLKVL